MQVRFDELETIIGYSFKDKELLRLALTHSSYSNDKKLGKLNNNERLEFLGDAVLELSTSEFLYHEFGEKPEGELTRLRASIVCEPTLAESARAFKLNQYLILGHGEENTGGRYRDSIISDALEALIGAIYLDGGFANAKEFVAKFVLNDIENKHLFYDSKTILQEIVQKQYKERVDYILISEDGPDHNKTFTVKAVFRNVELGFGKGATKKRAEQQAAYEAILRIKQENKDI